MRKDIKVWKFKNVPDFKGIELSARVLVGEEIQLVRGNRARRGCIIPKCESTV
jgi:hypothetical protein